MSQTNDGLITLFNVIGYLICTTTFATRAPVRDLCLFVWLEGSTSLYPTIVTSYWQQLFKKDHIIWKIVGLIQKI